MKKGTIRMVEPEHVAPVIVITLKGLEIPMYVKNELKYDKKEVEGFMKLLLFGVANETLNKEQPQNENTISISA
jgi:hypothetical protein